MKMKSLFTIVLGLTVLSACATTSGGHSHVRGSVVTLDSSQEGHVCLGRSEVAPGEKMNVFESVCKTELVDGENKPRSKTVCQKIARGDVEVVEQLSEHFAKVRSLGDLKLKEGFIIEKKIN